VKSTDESNTIYFMDKSTTKSAKKKLIKYNWITFPLIIIISTKIGQFYDFGLICAELLITKIIGKSLLR